MVRSKLGMMVEVPARELARRDAARHGIEKPEYPVRERPVAVEHRPVHDLVQQDGEVEDREALDEGEGNPHQRIAEADEYNGRDRKERELTRRDGEMPARRLAVEVPELLAGKRVAQLGPKRHGMLRIEVVFQGTVRL